MKSKTYIIIISITTFAEEKFISILKNAKYLIENKDLTYKIHWTFPTYLFEILKTNLDINNWFFKRIKNSGDIYIPGTYSGNPHEYMLHNEIHVDLYWALKNPFQSGYKDIFKNSPSIFYIYIMEKFRKKVLELYRRLNFNYIEGIREDYYNNKYLIFYKKNSQYVHEIQKLNSKKRKTETLIYFYEIKNKYDNQSFKEFLLAIKNIDKTLYDIKIQNLEGIKIQTKMLEIPEFNSLKEQSLIINFQNKRLREYQINEASLKEFFLCRKDNEQFKDIELTTNKNVEYNMEGSFSLSHCKYNIKFEDGRLSKIKCKEKNIEFLNSSTTYFKLNSKKDFTEKINIESSFSFVNDKIFGIRQYLSFYSNTNSIIDFFIDENLPNFFVSIKIEWPFELKIDKKYTKIINKDYLSEFSIFEIPIFEIKKGENIKITSKYSDFDSYEKIIETKLEEFKGYVNGTDFLFSKGVNGVNSFFISFLNVDKSIIHTIQYKIKKINSKRWFIINIGGSYNKVKTNEVLGYIQSINLILLPLNNNFDNKIKLSSKIKNLIFYTDIQKNKK